MKKLTVILTVIAMMLCMAGTCAGAAGDSQQSAVVVVETEEGVSVSWDAQEGTEVYYCGYTLTSDAESGAYNGKCVSETVNGTSLLISCKLSDILSVIVRKDNDQGEVVGIWRPAYNWGGGSTSSGSMLYVDGTDVVFYSSIGVDYMVEVTAPIVGTVDEYKLSANFFNTRIDVSDYLRRFASFVIYVRYENGTQLGALSFAGGVAAPYYGYGNAMSPRITVENGMITFDSYDGVEYIVVILYRGAEEDKITVLADSAKTEIPMKDYGYNDILTISIQSSYDGWVAPVGSGYYIPESGGKQFEGTNCKITVFDYTSHLEWEPVSGNGLPVTYYVEKVIGGQSSIDPRTYTGLTSAVLSDGMKTLPETTYKVNATMGTSTKQIAEVSLTGDYVIHTHDYKYDGDGKTHWQKCAECGEVIGFGFHETTDGVCDICGLKPGVLAADLDCNGVVDVSDGVAMQKILAGLS